MFVSLHVKELIHSLSYIYHSMIDYRS